MGLADGRPADALEVAAAWPAEPLAGAAEPSAAILRVDGCAVARPANSRVAADPLAERRTELIQ